MFTGPFAHPGLQIGSLTFRVSRNDITSRDGAGKSSGGSIGTPLWTATADLEALTDEEALLNEALIDSALGSAEQFIVSDPRRWLPKAYRNAGSLGGRTATASSFSLDGTRTQLTLNGLTAGTIISPTDLIGFKGGSGLTKRHCVNVLTGGTVSGGGTVSLKVYPAVWSVVSAWSSVVAHIDKPACSMKLTPETSIGDTSPDGRSTSKLVALQYLWD